MLLIVRVLLFWYQKQQLCIKWGKSCSTYFTICNGVRQGGILSPRLFALYVNQLTNQLIACKECCYFNDMCINHVLYADDIYLLALTASAMQTLLDVCYEYGIDNDILFNPIKSVCTVFKPKAYKLYLPTVFIGSDALKFIKESKYLGFTFNDSKNDDCDMLRQRDYCTPSLTNYYGHLVTVRRMLRLLCFKVIAQHCIVLICGMITKINI